QVRLGERMQVSWDLPAQLPEIQLPPLLLQPLLENAVYHGIQPNVAAGFIHVQLKLKDDHWLLQITNSKTKAGSVVGNQIAQANVRARLAALPQPAKLITNNQETTYQAQILLTAGVNT
ncbi:MAG TPA: sensor histidine kinase, partial [Pseudomonadales bacterium]|nr:sensor histidine kinase [Pseudomonadales bacterium]